MSFKDIIENDPRWQQRKTHELDRLLEVGPNQPMDSVQIEAIKEAGFEPWELRDAARNNGLGAKIFNPSESVPKSLVVWDEKALTDVLEKNKAALDTHGWRTDNFGFAEDEHTKGHSVTPELAEVVRQAYGGLPPLQVFDPESPGHGARVRSGRSGSARGSRGAA